VQVLKLDNFGSMDNLKKSMNEATQLQVKDLIMQKLRNQMKHMTKTTTKLKMGFITGDLRFPACPFVVLSIKWHSSYLCRRGSTGCEEEVH